MSAYRPFKNTKGMSTVWNQQVRYLQREHTIEVPDIHELFITDLCATLGFMREDRYHVIMGMDANHDVEMAQFLQH